MELGKHSMLFLIIKMEDLNEIMEMIEFFFPKGILAFSFQKLEESFVKVIPFY